MESSEPLIHTCLSTSRSCKH